MQTLPEVPVIPQSPIVLDQNHNWLSLFILCLYSGCYFFAWVLLKNPSMPLRGYKVFISGWAWIPALSLCTAFALNWLKKTVFPNNAAFYPALLVTNTLVWFWILNGMTANLSFEFYNGILRWVAVTNMTAMFVSYFPTVANLKYWPKWGAWARFLSPVPILCGLRHFILDLNLPATSWKIWLSFYLVAGVCLLLMGKKDHAAASPGWGWLDRFYLLALFLLLISLCLPFDKYHQNFYLGPINNILHGRSLLVDINCQYGVLCVYAMALFFKTSLVPLYYQQLSFMVMLAYIAQYLGLYWILRRIFRSQWLAIACVTLAVIMERYGYGPDWENLAYPSVGPMRFGPPLLLLSVVYLRSSLPKWSLLLRISELLLVGLVSLWSFETAVYCLASYVAVLFFESWGGASTILGTALRFFLRVLGLAVVILLAYGLFSYFTLQRSGSLPDWNMYLNYIHLYTYQQFGSLNFPTFSPWILIPGLSFLSLMACCFGLFTRRDVSAKSMFIFGLTFVSVAQFTYFLGRSHVNNLCHICVPSIIMAFYWIDRAWSAPETVGAARKSAAFSGFLLAAIFVYFYWPNASMRITQSLLYNSLKIPTQQGQTMLKKYVNDLSALDPAPLGALQTVTMIEKYFPHDERVPLIVPQDYYTEVLVRTNRISIFPISHPDEDDLLNMVRPNKPYDISMLKVGDILLLGQDAKGGFEEHMPYSPVDLAQVADQIKLKFKLQLVERGPQGVLAVKLAALK